MAIIQTMLMEIMIYDCILDFLLFGEFLFYCSCVKKIFQKIVSKQYYKLQNTEKHAGAELCQAQG